MSTLVIGAALLAFAAPAPSHHPRPSCQKLFTVPMAQRAARATFAGTRHVSLRDFKRLGRIEMCQRNPHAQWFARWYDRHQRARWRERRRAAAQIVPVAPPTGLVACIVHAESGGNPEIVNGSGHMGLGQWDEPTWLGDGGGRYAHTPLGASYSQQLSIIEEQVALGHTSQWTAYDPC